jgi:type IV pilus assembly protein PilA
MKKKNAFTLVELLAVIAVLGLILIIAVPKITNTMENSKKKTLVLTAKSIARSAEEQYIENEMYGINEEITCNSVSDYSSDDFSFVFIKLLFCPLYRNL